MAEGVDPALAEIRVPEAIPPISDAVAAADRAAVDEIEAERKKAELKGYQQDTDARKLYADRSFRLVCAALGSVMVLLVGSGVGWIHLSDPVLIAAISGATVNVIGIFLVVANYLFPRTPK